MKRVDEIFLHRASLLRAILRQRMMNIAISNDLLVVLLRRFRLETIGGRFMLRLVVIRDVIVVIQAQERRYGNFRPVRIIRLERFHLFAQSLHDLLLYINKQRYIYIYSALCNMLDYR